MSGRRLAFLDRDGVLNRDIGYCWRREDFTPVDGALEACARLARAGYLLLVVTNQSGIGRGLYGERDFQALCDWQRELFRAAGAPLSAIYFCPHHPVHGRGAYRVACSCRKPAPGMILRGLSEWDGDPRASVCFGDKRDDMRAAQAAGLRYRVLLGTDGQARPAAAPEATATATSLAEALELGLIPL